MENVNGEHGQYGMMTCSTTVNGKREVGRVRISNNALQAVVTEPPCLMLYCGTRLGKSGRTFVDVAVTKVPKGVTESRVRELADSWRKMSYTALRRMMMVQPLDNFPPNTIFVYKAPV